MLPTAAALLGLWIITVKIAVSGGTYYLSAHAVGLDAHAYWLSGHTPNPYGLAPGTQDAFLYSPTFALAIRPLTLLPWQVFFALWAAVEAVVIAWLLKPLGFAWGVPCFLLCSTELFLGNVNGLFGLVIVFGFRYPGLWAFPILTKILPGIGALWFVVRGEWRNAAIVAVTTTAIAVPTMLLAPDLWLDWLRFLLAQSGGITPSRVTRLVAGFVLVVVAARKDWRVLLPLVLFLATPVVSSATLLSLLAATPRLSRRVSRRSPTADSRPAEDVAAVRSV
jgi:Glycosyltransferase family 87